MCISVDGGGARRPPCLLRRQRRHLHHHRHRVRCGDCHRCRHSPPPPPPPSLPPLRHVTLGEGAHTRRGGINKIRPSVGRVFPSGHEKKSKYHGLVRHVMHDFYVEISPRQKSGDAFVIFAPVRLHRLICHKGINTWRIIAARRRNGGGRSYYIIGIWAQLAIVSHFGDYFRSAGRHPKK